MDNPCFGCKARRTRCHADCGRYTAFREAREAEYKETARRGVEVGDFLHVTDRRFKRAYKRRDE